MHCHVFITQNISVCSFLALATVINHNTSYNTHWLAVAGQKICILGSIRTCIVLISCIFMILSPKIFPSVFSLPSATVIIPTG